VSEIQTLAPNPRKEKKKMATKENAPKQEKAIILDSSIVKDYRQLVKNSLESHWGFITNTNQKMVDGSASVRIVKASINEASKDGQDSIIKASQVEGFSIALKVKGLSGADKQTISTILKASMRAKRLDGVEAVDALLDGIKTWDGFIARLEDAEDSKAEAKAEAEATEEIEAKELDLAGITWEALAEIVIKKAKMEKNMVDATCEIKLAGQATAIFNTLVKNTQAKAKVNA
jgi:hypothetical protein